MIKVMSKLARIVHTSSDRCVPSGNIRRFIELLESPKSLINYNVISNNMI
nr:MAG TPA: hypothetical protein [Bacteriophage sp.]